MLATVDADLLRRRPGVGSENQTTKSYGNEIPIGNHRFYCYVSFREGKVCITVKIIDFVFTSFTNSNPGGVSKMSMCKVAGNFFEFWDVDSPSRADGRNIFLI